jgi:hypothetical protein
MATVAAGQKFLGVASTMDTTEKKSDALNANTEYYTIEDLQSYTSEDLAHQGAASLTKTMSYFTTGGAETATLAAGVDGQLKMFTMIGDGGDMVVTVTNPSWGGSGTLTFASVGDACTLIYAGSKWSLIGNNGVVAA